MLPGKQECSLSMKQTLLQRLLCAFLVAFPSISMAKPVLLDDVISSVKTHFPLIRAAEHEKSAAAAELISSYGIFDPQLRMQGDASVLGPYQNGRFETRYTQPTPIWGTQIFAGYRVGFGSFPSADEKWKTNQYGEIFAGIEIPVLRNGPIDRRRADLEKARLGPHIAHASLEQQQIDAIRNASHRYLEWVASQQRLHIAEELLALAEQRSIVFQRRVTEGDLPKLEWIDNERTVLQRKGFVLTATRLVEQAQLELSIYLRDGNGNPVVPNRAQNPAHLPMPGEALSIDAHEESSHALSQRPELARLRFQKEQWTVEQAWAQNQLWPMFSVYAGISQDFGPGDRSKSSPTFDLGVRIEIPTLNRFATGKFQVASKQLLRLESQQQFVRDQILVELQNVASLLHRSYERIEVAQSEVEIAKQTQTGEWKKFEQGDSSILFVNLREQSTAEAKVRWVDALLEYHKAIASYEFTIAKHK